MTLQTKFDGETLQFDSKIRRLTKFIDVTMPPLVAANDIESLRFLMETVVVMTVAYLDRYLTNLISTATFARERDARVFLQKHGTEREKEQSRTCDIRVLRAIMTSRASLLARNGRRVDETFEFLLGFGLWPSDERTAKLIRDLARLRNLILHHDGHPEYSHFTDMEVPGFITAFSKELGFYRMNLVTSASLVLEGLQAVFALLKHIQGAIAADERWKWRGPLEHLPPTLIDEEH